MKFFKKSEEPEQETKTEELRQIIADAMMPPDVQKIAYQEIETLSTISQTSAEYTIGITYIDYLAAMPWNKKTEDNLDLNHAEMILLEDHYGLQAIKERILEHLAVRVLMKNKKPRVMVVDDEDVARKNLVHILSKENYDVIPAADGNEALQKLASTEFDVVVTDLRMPGIDGMELLENIRKHHPDTRVIMVTGHATVSSAVEAMKEGAFYYITKPFKLDEVRSTVKNAVEKRASMECVRGSVLCFSGPPGTGKTSMGISIAKALGRKFIRFSLGGIKDEAAIRGHSRTYVGAKPGRIIDAIRRVESANPVIMLDEVDKMSYDSKGDPASALLEVLDPEQNQTFVDHYLDVPFDLSSVMFILTANLIDNVQGPLKDRMEIIEFSGYTLEEKAKIASQYLLDRQIREKGLSEYPPVFTEQAFHRIIQAYTREAGIRDLDRNVATICRRIAKELVQHKGTLEPVTITPDLVEHYLGPRKYRFEIVEEKDRIGVSTGLVLTETGGDIIFIEAAKMMGNKELIMTGSLGEVMRESAQAALSYIRSNAKVLAIPEDFFEHNDIHIHIPSGAIQKDGPSAGITIAVALISLLTRRPVMRDVALTGEMTLTGRILPVRGIKEKILAAKRAQVNIVVLPLKNKVEVEELSDDIRQGIFIHMVDTIDEVIELALAKG
ncbi:MAG: endopeptidase La [Dissulfurispiraceae bacterium]